MSDCKTSGKDTNRFNGTDPANETRCKTEVFELLLTSSKVKQNNYGSGRYF
jgi:hypothetical protein